MQGVVALLRAVNVGGTGKLAMAELRRMCGACGFENVKTYIASGNAVFSTGEDGLEVAAMLEERLLEHAGKPVAVMVRTADEMGAVLAQNPFADAPPNRVAVMFLKCDAEAAMLDQASGHRNEQTAIGCREIYIHYPDGMGQSRFQLAIAAEGTMRNINTVRKLAAMARAVG